MSRTYKTNPEWVGRDWVPVHHRTCEHYIKVCSGIYTKSPKRPCNLPVDPPRRWNRVRFWLGEDCGWEPDLPRFYPYTNRPEPEHKKWARPKSVAEQANRIERGIRAAWRTYRQGSISSIIYCIEGCVDCPCRFDEAVHDTEPPDPRHRRFALWDRW